MTFLLLIFIFSFLALPTSTGPGLPCLSYEPKKVTLNGTIKRKTFAGAPNYESIAKGDQPEVTWILHLTRPICVTASGEWKEERNVFKVQLVFPEGEKQYASFKSLIERRVVVIGSLFHSHTGHHHTKLLLTVTRMRRKT